MGYLLVGLQNLSNLCYLNAVIQLFLSATEFNEHIIEFFQERSPKEILQYIYDTYPEQSDEYGLKYNLLYIYHALLNFLREPNTGPSIRRLLENQITSVARLQEAIVELRPDLSNNEQQDVHEVFNLLLTSFQEIMFEIYESRVPGAMVSAVVHPKNSFQGLQKISFTCNNCSHVTSKHEVFNNLICPIVNNDIRASIMATLLPEQIEDYTCENCKGKHNCTRNVTLEQLPDYLVIFFQRNQFRQGKNHQFLYFLPVLEILPQQPFKWLGAIQHLGLHWSFGHYVYLLNLRNEFIVHMDDENVRLSADQVIEFHPYMLIFERISRKI